MASKMAVDGRDLPNKVKRSLNSVSSTLGKNSYSPLKKQTRGDCKGDHQSSDTLAESLQQMLEANFDALATRLEKMLPEKLKDLEVKFETRIGKMEKVQELKNDYNESLSHVEEDLNGKISETWEYAVQNEQNSRKNIRIFGLREEHSENLEEVIKFAKESLNVHIRNKEIEIVHRMGRMPMQSGDGNMRSRATIIKFLSNKSKMKLLLRRWALKGKKISIAEDLAKRLKEKASVERASFVNGKNPIQTERR